MNQVEKLRRALAAAQRKSQKAAEARAALPAGASRARVTSANARWARAAEHRDRLARQLKEAESTSAPRPRLIAALRSALADVAMLQGQKKSLRDSLARVTAERDKLARKVQAMEQEDRT